MSQFNPYQPASSLPQRPTDFLKVSVQPIELFRRGRALLGDQYWLFVGIVLVGMIIGSVVPFGLLLGIMMVGIFSCMIQREQGQRVEFGGLFKGFENVGPPLLAMLIIVGIFCAILLPLVCGFMGAVISTIPTGPGNNGRPAEPNPFLFLGFELVLIVLMTFLMIPFCFTFQLIADRRLPAMEAIKMSLRGATYNLFGLAMFFVVNTFVSTVLTMMCYLPGILFMPISFAALFVLYRDVFPREPVMMAVER